MQLTARLGPAMALAAALALVGAERGAAGDGDITVRGAYYKERSTRVAQPMVDGRFDLGPDGELRAHALVDSISSASVASGAIGDSFSERRFEMGASYLHRVGLMRLGGGLRFSSEPDYQSAFAHLRGEADLGDRNTTIALYLAGGRDAVSNEGAQNPMSAGIEGVLYTSVGSVSLSQVLTPVLVGQLTYDLAHLDGFQENPYRSVAAGGVLEPERVPETRTRHAAQAALRGFVAATRSTLIGSYRLYADDWGVVGNTPEVRLVQQIIPSLDLHLRYRYHHQNAAEFYEPVYDSADPAMEPYITDDAKLGRLTTQTFGGKLEVGVDLFGVTDGPMAGARAQASFDYITQSTYYGNAVSAQLAISVPFAY
ncbi:MAG TPA: DUF3570 domain-containing protein [Kofleriaceae bacterium]|nr:DUF3570 domain-containing protein [Kofleriaceae bacterium]